MHVDETKEAVGDRLRKLRLVIHKEDNQARWCAKLDPSGTYIYPSLWSNWEKGRVYIPRDKANYLAGKVPAVSTDWIFRGKRDHVQGWLLEALDELDRREAEGHKA